MNKEMGDGKRYLRGLGGRKAQKLLRKLLYRRMIDENERKDKKRRGKENG